MRLTSDWLHARIANLSVWPVRAIIGRRILIYEINIGFAQRGFIVRAYLAYEAADGQYLNAVIEGHGLTPIGALWSVRRGLSMARAT